MTQKQRLFIKTILKLFLAGLISISALIFYCNILVLKNNDFNLSVDNAPTMPVAIIFGGGIYQGEQTVYQVDRVQVGVNLFKAGKVEKLIMTGDDGGNLDDETAAMKLFAIKLGVPKENITIDPHGYRTYASCYRARAVYGVANAIVVSQSFHLPRILYLCRGLGLEVSGVSADLHSYGWSGFKVKTREVLARVKAWWELNIF